MAGFQRIRPIGLGILIAHAGGFLGLVAGVIYSVGGAAHDLVNTGFNAGTLLAFGALVGMPAIFAGAGFVVGSVSAIVFNLVSPRIGGNKVELFLKD